MPLVLAGVGVSLRNIEVFLPPNLRAWRRKASSSRTFQFDFVYLYVDETSRRRRRRRPSPRLELHTRAGALLLNFTSRLHSVFRFGLERHKFATDAHARKATATNSESVISRRKPRVTTSP